MRQFAILILMSALVLVFTQCSFNVKPSKRTHSNSVGIWIGTSTQTWQSDDKDESMKHMKNNWAVGVNIKHLNPKILANSFFNANSGIHFGKSYGISVDASFNLLTDDLGMEMHLDGNGSACCFQLYAGPNLGASLINKNGKQIMFNPTLGLSYGMLILIPESGKYPESDLSIDGVVMENVNDIIFKNKPDMDFLGRLMYNLYLF